MASQELKRLYQSQLLYLLERPAEPVFVPKGSQRAVFQVPHAEFLPSRYQPIAQKLEQRYGPEAGVRVPIQDIQIPDVLYSTQLSRRDNFSLFNPFHREMSSRLIDLFMSMESYDDFLSACVYCRDRMNPYMYVYALSVAVLHRQDTRGIQLPPLAQIFPHKFIDGAVFSMAREDAYLLTEDERQILVIPPDFTGTDLEEEHRVAYFREDIGVNLHHWHWHLVYPFQGPLEIVNKDRRGELFYYMHQQIMARYNFERLSNQLGRTSRFNLRQPIQEGYFPKLNHTNASRVWAGRHSGAQLRDINREDERLRFAIQDMEAFRERIMEAIHRGSVTDPQGQVIPLDEERGIDILGNIIESSILNVNPVMYGNLHNMGHLAIAYVHDPDGRHMETFSVMGDATTAMRDPVFYTWHAYIDEIFQTHKNLLPRYSPAQLDYQGIRVTNVEVVTTGGRRNELDTFWQQQDMDISRGLDFVPRTPIFIRFTHLQHTSFLYRIQVENTTKSTVEGTVRIFLAPKFNERGKRMLLRDQRHLFIEMDKFQVKIRSNPRRNMIERESTSSSVTIPFVRTFEDLEGNPGGPPEMEPFNYCGCGWPDHLLVPRGTPEGFPCQLFVMISNVVDDVVRTTNSSSLALHNHSLKDSLREKLYPYVDEPNPATGKDSDASSYCGLRNRRYPDRRSMGFPFDRDPPYGVNNIEQFLTPNMFVTDVHIFYNNHTEPPKNNSIGN
ncbi:hypothetical protein J437_LFUL002224 [Ladona fulva]|uniref:Tyrosinase copper-binding domain-containing protein n=1 Tax=Ladona fulva TaxID=123851 RepID=A0A8K0NU65_LADFU|nr:hypothetical protein J437_LFUL002224 [Ladona fulva]